VEHGHNAQTTPIRRRGSDFPQPLRYSDLAPLTNLKVVCRKAVNIPQQYASNPAPAAANQLTPRPSRFSPQALSFQRSAQPHSRVFPATPAASRFCPPPAKITSIQIHRGAIPHTILSHARNTRFLHSAFRSLRERNAPVGMTMVGRFQQQVPHPRFARVRNDRVLCGVRGLARG